MIDARDMLQAIPGFMLLLFLLPALPACAAEGGPEGLARVTRQLCAYHLQSASNAKAPTSVPADVAGYLAGLKPDGSWGDIDYTPGQMAVWPALTHMSRVLAMTKCWRNSVEHGQAQDALLNGIHAAFGYWARLDLQSPNWWFNQIGAPEITFTTGLLLGSALQPAERAFLLDTVLPRVKIGMTGQNRLWLAANTLMGGLLQGDEARVSMAAQTIFAEVAVTEREGIQPDFSFHQHGPQLQFGNYGLSFAVETAKWGEIFSGSPWALQAQQLQLFRRYLLDGQRWVCWRGQMDISSCGRQLAPGSPASKARSISRAVAGMATLDPDRAGEYAAIAREISPGETHALIGTRHFWRSDYLVHRRPTFCATLKMCSARTTGGESINSENLSGYYLADGACFFYRTGNEYRDIFPLWNWRQLPGVTCPQKEGAPPPFVEVHATSTFVGGATDGANGCAALDYRRDGVSAKKAWFFIGDTVACLGAGIETAATMTDPVATTVNQCYLRGEVRVTDGAGERAMATGAVRADDIRQIEHDGLRYTFPEKQAVVASAGPQTGNWAKVVQTSVTPKADVTGNLFTLRIEHGAGVADGSYAYFVQPADAAPREIVMVANTPRIQAVRAGSLLLAVFHAAAALPYATGHLVTVSNPCLLIMDSADPAGVFYVADPTQKLATLTVTRDGLAREVALPQGGERGKTAVAVLGKER